MKRADELRFDEAGLIPAIVQDAASKEVLTLAYMNRESYEKTIETKETWFYSRSRQELWHKGATSGNTQKVKAIRYDCDQDALVVLAEPSGPACHKGSYSCFTPEKADVQDRFGILNELESVIAKRQTEMPDGAYTTYLFREGVDKILKKVGEEAAEVIIAAKNRDHEELKWEAADLLYHLLVLLREQSLPLDDVLAVLAKRHSSSE
ncbi:MULTISPECIES: bifunctional phosphoribosyl-AMP cyclohydrolase/phosphoribosyl-ATP diphosphatase HisIE [Bacillus]|uniref:Histidine biosynthesis bifunctional protein HisIE n=1 Tax=Bacillus amyloliquefaciens (strain ATCC 23350 / DSM 7 / BCRC 11601 / CCUG 28519 / NBRC 15535 / NRRL B-14393 / F) TaxID=692420 RepID=A0A9P1JKA4_BACAS|nr:bifunctional phosphoribosyl-AMP cyclohydrolase/phosphoribosyl-ATP diphosphatase HisIE [Bacillus amyloliquefaciens]AIW35327.1 phosphoribosyl-ATP pyrophosphatase [Bacillus subtilis]AEB25687.1 bifunctional phosphoribosyl-AMP cyclohydrolase/phosphoribosyl-ATP pyrophosphatase protein [Bacillus amyloliquefaciens TA208]AEB65152.1 phosphoribosyl-AMP cyclohydrolase; phosphoribosyl-ATP pyrophosphohydrolase [Bacillus amyloliquefaciens LL3]AEK90726.1 bifunctional phosphoribosyl-AMP [Bacillus amyloliquef